MPNATTTDQERIAQSRLTGISSVLTRATADEGTRLPRIAARYPDERLTEFLARSIVGQRQRNGRTSADEEGERSQLQQQQHNSRGNLDPSEEAVTHSGYEIEALLSEQHTDRAESSEEDYPENVATEYTPISQRLATILPTQQQHSPTNAEVRLPGRSRRSIESRNFERSLIETTRQLEAALGEMRKSLGHSNLDQIHTVAPSSLLATNSIFAGTQCLAGQASEALRRGHAPDIKEEWSVQIQFQSVDYRTGSVYGLMRAYNVPNAPSVPGHVISTWFEGELIDFSAKRSLLTKKWHASPRTDFTYWRKLVCVFLSSTHTDSAEEPFSAFDDGEMLATLLRSDHVAGVCEKYIFMRLKERSFVDNRSSEAGLTIAGFYYVCVRRSDGNLEGSTESNGEMYSS